MNQYQIAGLILIIIGALGIGAIVAMFIAPVDRILEWVYIHLLGA